MAVAMGRKGVENLHQRRYTQVCVHRSDRDGWIARWVASLRMVPRELVIRYICHEGNPSVETMCSVAVSNRVPAPHFSGDSIVGSIEHLHALWVRPVSVADANLPTPPREG